jgi:hypothetical protein
MAWRADSRGRCGASPQLRRMEEVSYVMRCSVSKAESQLERYGVVRDWCCKVQWRMNALTWSFVVIAMARLGN